MIAAMYTRRGGIDINPIRASHPDFMDETLVSSKLMVTKTLRQWEEFEEFERFEEFEEFEEFERFEEFEEFERFERFEEFEEFSKLKSRILISQHKTFQTSNSLNFLPSYLLFVAESLFRRPPTYCSHQNL